MSRSLAATAAFALSLLFVGLLLAQTRALFCSSGDARAIRFFVRRSGRFFTCLCFLSRFGDAQWRRRFRVWARGRARASARMPVHSRRVRLLLCASACRCAVESFVSHIVCRLGYARAISVARARARARTAAAAATAAAATMAEDCKRCLRILRCVRPRAHFAVACLRSFVLQSTLVVTALSNCQSSSRSPSH